MKIEGMPEISKYGVYKIVMVHRLGKHKEAYIKIIRGDKSASISLMNLKVHVNSGIPSDVVNTVSRWCEKNKEKLLESWKKEALLKKPITKIPFEVLSDYSLLLRSVKLFDDYTMEGVFNNGIKMFIDFKPFKAEFINMAAPLNDIKFFKEGRIKNGWLTWPNGFDLDPENLYEIGDIVEEPKAG